MKANELRLGNHVYDSTDHCQIDVKCSDLCYSSNFEPIPLTEYIFKDIDGVEKAPYDDDIKDYYLIKRCGFFDIIYEDDDNIYIDFGDTLKKVKYLHQLQNLHFALTSKEITIK